MDAQKTKKPKSKLTEAEVLKFKCPPDKRQAFFWCAETRGFGLRAMPDAIDPNTGAIIREGTKAFVFQGRVARTGDEVRDTLGRWGDPGVTVRAMRTKAEEYRKKLNDGINPVQEQRDRIAAEAAAAAQAQADAEAAKRKAIEDAELAKQRALCLKDVAADYIAFRRTSKGALRPKTVNDINRHVERSFASWSTLPISQITPELVQQRYRELAKHGLTGDRPAPVQATQAFVCLRALLRWAAQKYRVAGVPLVQGNPVEALRGEWHKAGDRSEHVPPARLGRVFAALQARSSDTGLQRSDRTGADLVMLQLLTGMRPGEVRALEWKRVHLEEDSGWWHMPKELSKNGREFWLPLSAPARELLKVRKRTSRSPWVFPARSGDGHVDDYRGTLDHIEEAAGLRVRPHDLRRSYIAAGIHLGIELWKLELLTCHINKGSVTVSNYVEKSRLQYLAPEQERIGAWIVEQANIAAGRNVVPLKQQKRA